MKTSVLALFLTLGLTARAGIDPYYKDAIERGYKIKGDSVVFPDGSTCPYKAFLKGACGTKWKTDDYCVPEGKPVWDEKHCCKGLQAYVMPGSDGQATCEKLPGKELRSKLKWLYWVFPGVMLLFALFGLRNYLNKRKKAGQS